MISMMAFSIVSSAQRIAVSGTIVDETGDPVPGVNILEKGTANGTSSDAEGKYSINVADGSAILVFSFIGFKTEEVTVGSRNAINITLTADATSLEEVVVTGYSEQRKKRYYRRCYRSESGRIENVGCLELRHAAGG